MRSMLSLALALSALTLLAQTASSPFVGNKEAKVFHVPSCKLVLKIKPENKVGFASKEEAEKAGYTPCKICLKP